VRSDAFLTCRVKQTFSSPDFERLVDRHNSFVVQRIFGTRKALVQIFTAIDERVRYPRDSGIPVEQFSFGLFSRWVPKDVPLESDMPDLAVSLFRDHRMQASEREASSTAFEMPRTQRPLPPVDMAPRILPSPPPETETANSGLLTLNHMATWPRTPWRCETPPSPRASLMIGSENTNARGVGKSAVTPGRIFRSIRYPELAHWALVTLLGTGCILLRPGTSTLSMPNYTSETPRRSPFPSLRPTWFPAFVVIEDLNPERLSDCPVMPFTLAITIQCLLSTTSIFM
jgi:hypothetical protein